MRLPGGFPGLRAHHRARHGMRPGRAGDPGIDLQRRSDSLIFEVGNVRTVEALRT